MADDVKRKIVVDSSDIDKAIDKNEQLNQEMESGQEKATAVTKRGVSKRVQAIRDGLAKTARDIRAGLNFRVQELEKQLRRGLITEKKFQQQRVRLSRDANAEIAKAGKIAREGTASGASAASVAAGIGGALAGSTFLAGAREALELSKELELSQKRLESNARAFGQSQTEALAAANEIAADGLLTFQQASQGLSSLISAGFGVQDALDISKGLKDVGAFGNIVGDLGQAFVDATKGIKTNSIELIENIGLTTRLGSALQKQGFTTDDLSDKTKGLAAREALRNIILADTSKFTGDAAKFSETFAGAQARLETATRTVGAALGDTIKQGFAPLASALADAVEGFGKLFSDLDNGKRVIVVLSAAIAALVVPVSAAISAFGGFAAVTALINPVSLAIAGVALAVGGLTIALDRLAPSTDKLIRQAQEEKSETQKLGQTIDDLSRKRNRTKQEEDQLAIAKTNLRQKAIELGIALEDENGKLKDQARLTRDVTKAQNDLANEPLFDRLESLREAQGEQIKLLQIETIAEERKARFRRDIAIRQKQITDLENEIRRNSAKVAEEEADSKRDSDTRVLVSRERTTRELLELERQRIENQIAAGAEGLELQGLQLQDEAAQQELAFIEQARTFDEAQRRKLQLQADFENASNKQRKAALKKQVAIANAELKVEEKKLAAIRKADAENKRFREAVAEKLFDFNEALLSKEEGAFKRFLASQIRAFARFIAKKLFLEGTAKLSNPLTAGIGAAQIAASFVVLTGGTLLAQRLEAEADQRDEESPPQLDAAELSSATGATTTEVLPAQPGPTTVINHFDNSQNNEVNMLGTWLDTASAVRERLGPELDALRIEQGKTVFAGQG